MFMMLTGWPPYEGPNELEIIRAVKDNQFNSTALENANLSDEAKELLNQMLNTNPNARISADLALNSKWIKLHDKSDLDLEITRRALIALSKFNT